jgi:Fuc2NAc and GlcNAc transferase
MLYISIIILSLVLTYIVREVAIKKALFDMPNDRSSHTAPTPHGGGIAIAVSWFVGISCLFFSDSIDSSLYFALMAGAIISIVSYVDDIRELSPKVRLFFQVFVSVVGVSLLGGLQKLDFGLFSIENIFLVNIIAVVATIWFINLYNFLDGINGYAGVEAICLAIGGFLLFGDNLFLVLIASVLGFMYFNFRDKAKIFMGDVGSTLLGYNVAIFAIYYQNSDTSILIWLILFGLYWFDATLTLIRRYKNGEKLSQAHKKHTYQRATQSGLSHIKVSTIAIGLNSILLAISYIAINNNMLQLPLFIISLIFLYSIVKWVDKRKKFE